MKNVLTAASIIVLLLPLLVGGHASAAQKTAYKRTVENYTIPDVTLINQQGRKVKLLSLINSGKPVMLDFIYGTCTTICPVLSAGFSSFQNRIGTDVSKVQLISISIDPEHDTPEIMKDYLARFRAKPGWDFLTGRGEDIDHVMKAFDAYAPNKMAHHPVTFLKAPNSSAWVRIYGLVSMSTLMEEYRMLGEK